MRRVLIISASVHVVCLALLPIIPNLGVRQPLAMEVYAVELVDIPREAPVEEVVEETAPEPEPTPVEPEPEPEEAPIPEEPVKRPRREIVPPPPKRVEKSLEERIKERMEQEDSKRPEEKPREEEPTPAPSPASMEVRAGSVIADSYLIMLQGKITRNWKQPSAHFTAGESPTATISFTVLRSGDIKNLRIARSSGWPAVDQSAVQAVRSSAPFGELYTTYPGDHLDVTIDFTPRQ
jgi:protein TonB